MLRTGTANRSIRSISFLAILAMVAALMGLNGAISAVAADQPTITSDQADYRPGATVTLTGTNWGSDTSVNTAVNDTLGNTRQHVMDVGVAADGTITDVFDLPTTFVAEYDVTATGNQSGLVATTTFTDASADLDQCANGGVGDPPEWCNGSFPANWINGNLGKEKSSAGPLRPSGITGCRAMTAVTQAQSTLSATTSAASRSPSQLP